MLKHFKKKLNNNPSSAGHFQEFISQQNMGGGVLSEPVKLSSSLKSKDSNAVVASPAV